MKRWQGRKKRLSGRNARSVKNGRNCWINKKLMRIRNARRKKTDKLKLSWSKKKESFNLNKKEKKKNEKVALQEKKEKLSCRKNMKLGLKRNKLKLKNVKRN